MSADEMHTQLPHERAELITQADILKRLVDIQDSQYVQHKETQESLDHIKIAVAAIIAILQETQAI